MKQNLLDFNIRPYEPIIVVISGPSGVGKDATLMELKRRNPTLHFVITVTSRPIRAGEQEGVDYFFVSAQKFEEMIDRAEFIEYARVYDDYKGVPRSQIQNALSSGEDVILRLDVQGAARIKELYPEAILIFIIPKNQEEWLRRITERRTETAESLNLRVETAFQELKCLPEFDYVVINSEGQLIHAVETIEAILIAEHHKNNNRKVK
jgi:guanylate kinase